MIGSVKFIGIGTSKFLEEDLVTNDQVLERLLRNGVTAANGKTSDDVFKSTGIRTRYISPLSAHELGRQAAYAATCHAVETTRGIFKSGSDLSLVYTTSSSPDVIFPASSAKHQYELGISGLTVAVADISLACTGFVAAVDMAISTLRDRHFRLTSTGHKPTKLYGLVIAEESIGRTMNPDDDLGATLWGTGAGAVVLEYDPEGDPTKGIVASSIYSDGRGAGHAEGRNVGTHQHSDDPKAKAWMLHGGKSIYRWCNDYLYVCLGQFYAQWNIKDEPYLFFTHNANDAMVRNILANVMDFDKCVRTTTKTHGNMSSASLPVTLCRHWEEFQSPGKQSTACAQGAGMSIGFFHHIA